MTSFIAEAYTDIYNRLYVTNDTTILSQHVYKVIAEGQPDCTVSAPFFCVIPSFTSYNAIGNTDLNILPSIAADEGNLYSVINIFYAAVRLDLGHWTSDNVSCSISSTFSRSFVSRGVHQYYIVQTINSRHGRNQLYLPQYRDLQRDGICQLHNPAVRECAHIVRCYSDSIHM